jgi:hypothetical protein
MKGTIKTQMTELQIKQRIAESGKMTQKDVLNYFKRWEGQYDSKTVRSIAKEMIGEAKKYY